ncbi:MAG TPA: MATE family efflux transporter [Anaerohalosphaeraceae bacterium]|nr:MATE family efflux transporter [Anaerohalosphaeraceae bacterium]HPP55380.1 MATE family efflux transporter [Anaerohalosphaeraceae bacterium]
MKSIWKEHYPGPGGIKEMLTIAFPMVISSACDTIMIFTDRLFLSRLGPHQMSAAMGGGLTCFMLSTFFLGVTGYCTALTAQCYGAGRKTDCPVVITQGLIISILAWPLILAARPLAWQLFVLTKIPPEQLGPQTVYFNILLYGVLISLFRNCLSSFFSGIGKTRTVMVSAIVSTVSNIFINYILIFGHLGFPALGIRGAAYGTILGGFLGLLVLAAVYLLSPERYEFAVARSFRYDSVLMKKLWRFGTPAGIEFFLNMLAFTLLILNFHACGLQTATAVTIVFNWDLVSFIPLVGIHVGVTSLVGRYMGGSEPDTADRATFSGLKLAWAYSFCTMLTFALLPHPLVEVFRPPQEDAVFAAARPEAVFMLRMAALYVMADATMLVFSGALRGAGDTFWAMAISVSMHWTLVIGQLFLLKIAQLSPRWTWGFLCLTLLAFSGLIYLRYRTGRWRTIQILDRIPSPPPLEVLHEIKDL